tara:strand:- start:392 stop:1573 length:1182 start_codon:yes stop_codon:yes gene_type:complete
MNFLFVCTHPIQNLIPLFVELNKKTNLNFKVLYWEKISKEYFDPLFNQKINFNIETFKGYKFEYFYENKNNTEKVTKTFNQILVSLKLIKYIFKSKTDVVLVYGYYLPHIILLLFAKILGKKTIIRSVSYNLGNRNFFKRLVRKLFYNIANLLIDEFWSVGKLNTDFYLDFGVNEKNIRTIPSSQITKNFVFKDDLDFEETKKKFINTFHQINKKKIILYPGKFLKKKRPMFLIECFANAKLSDEWILVLVGGGGFYHQQVINYLKKNNPNNIFYLGFKDLKEILVLYDLSEIIVLPSDFGETNGNVLHESSQFNCTCITSNRVGAYPEVLNFKRGLVFDAQKKNDFINKIELLTNDINLRNQLKQNNLKFSEKIKPSYAANKIYDILSNYEL